MDASSSRAPKTSIVQWQVLVDFLIDHPEMVTRSFVGIDGRQNYNKLWEEITIQLNSLGYGAKTAEKWIEAFTKWKSKVKVKAQNLRLDMARTGGGGPLPQLTPVEEKLMGIIGWTVVEGDATVELGLAQPRISGNTDSDGPSKYNQPVEVFKELSKNVEIEPPPLIEIGSPSRKRKMVQKQKSISVKKKSESQKKDTSVLRMHEETIQVLREINANLSKLAQHSVNSNCCCCCKCQSTNTTDSDHNYL